MFAKQLAQAPVVAAVRRSAGQTSPSRRRSRRRSAAAPRPSRSRARAPPLSRAEAPMAGGAAAAATGSCRPRAELAAGGRTLTNRVHVLIGQASHVAAEVQRAAVQELMLLAGHVRRIAPPDWEFSRRAATLSAAADAAAPALRGAGGAAVVPRRARLARRRRVVAPPPAARVGARARAAGRAGGRCWAPTRGRRRTRRSCSPTWCGRRRCRTPSTASARTRGCRR